MRQKTIFVLTQGQDILLQNNNNIIIIIQKQNRTTTATNPKKQKTWEKKNYIADVLNV